ncbi:hypothetical protein BEN47_07075 [Hymenobacter lapidarius]|uniref:Outer membrane protein beta-barrel domain-containing protein n=1 Tax=Hymenobacter lapidarius TaxID=1908237 RepID=A0A1G1TEV9_9BACT|nr:hypothetical protein [Hymenobacter lapidarius]OGX89400.1 hypothetical protein BEN47_07075 [Hymenobacter lapidarius]
MDRFSLPLIGKLLPTVIAVLALASPVLAQSTSSVVAETPAVESASPRNAIRFDVGSVLVHNIVNNAFGYSGTLFPILASYERQVGARGGLVAEGLANGGNSWARRVGLSVQGRYYFRFSRSKAALTGLYVAPVVAFRTVSFSGYYKPIRQHYSGVGALLGAQASLKPRSPWFIDVAAGLMSWKRLSQAKAVGNTSLNPSLSQESYYDTHPTDFDGRLGLGFRF